MSTSPIELRPLARTVLVTDDDLTVGLADGRAITVPLVWFPRLLRATVSARSKWERFAACEPPGQRTRSCPRERSPLSRKALAGRAMCVRSSLKSAEFS